MGGRSVVWAWGASVVRKPGAQLPGAPPPAARDRGRAWSRFPGPWGARGRAAFGIGAEGPERWTLCSCRAAGETEAQEEGLVAPEAQLVCGLAGGPRDPRVAAFLPSPTPPLPPVTCCLRVWTGLHGAGLWAAAGTRRDRGGEPRTAH